jgi:hypothetical protein
MQLSILGSSKQVYFHIAYHLYPHAVQMGVSLATPSLSVSRPTYGNHLITPSKATKAMALAGNARKNEGKKPRQ